MQLTQRAAAAMMQKVFGEGKRVLLPRYPRHQMDTTRLHSAEVFFFFIVLSPSRFLPLHHQTRRGSAIMEAIDCVCVSKKNCDAN